MPASRKAAVQMRSPAAVELPSSSMAMMISTLDGLRQRPCRSETAIMVRDGAAASGSALAPAAAFELGDARWCCAERWPQGTLRSPGCSSTRMMSARIGSKTPAEAPAAPRTPKTFSSRPDAAPIVEEPTTWPAAMRLLARPSSSGRRRKMAIPSIATSMEAEHMLTRNPSVLRRGMLTAASALAEKPADMTPRHMTSADIHATTHGRRKPKLRHVQLSMSGPTMGLKLQGKNATALKLATASMDNVFMSHVGKARLSSPLGIPSAK